MSCDLAHTNICAVNNCIIQVDGMESNSASPSDTWFLTFNNETTYDGIPVKKAFLKLFIDPEHTPHTLTSSITHEIKGLEYELNIYKDVIRPLIDLDICPNFVKYLGSTKNCTYKDILNFLVGKIENAFRIKFSKTECEKRLNYNILNCLLKKCVERPPINHNIGHKISDILDPVKNRLRFDMLLTETKQGSVKFFDFINNIIIPKIDTARNILWETLFQIVAACYAMSLSKMVHNDLHSNNIFIEDLGDEKTFLYVINDIPYILKTRYKVLIYDFDRGYVNRLGTNKILSLNSVCRDDKQCNHFVDSKDILKIMCYVFLPLLRTTSTTLPDLLNILLSSLGPELNNEIFNTYINNTSNFDDCYFGPSSNTDQDRFFRQFYTSSDIVKNIGNNLPKYTIEDFSDIDTDKLYVCNSVFFNTNGEIKMTEYNRTFDETIVKLQNKNEEYKSIFRDIPIIPRAVSARTASGTAGTPARPASTRAASIRAGTPLVYPSSARAVSPRAGTPVRPASGTAGTPARPASTRAASGTAGTPLVYPSSIRPASTRAGTPVRPVSTRAASIRPEISSDDIFSYIDDENLEKIEELIKAGVDLNIQNENDSLGVTPIMYTIDKNKSIEIVDMLIKAGANVNLQSIIIRSTALMFAIFYTKDKLKLVDMLIDAGAIVNLQNNYGETALIYSAEIEGDEKIVDKLIKAGANLNLQNNRGNTALIKAVFYNNIKIVDMLIKAGADINIKNKKGETALDLAKKFSKVEIIDILTRANNSLELENFEFDTENIDERTFSFTTCKDIISDENENITDYLSETDTFLFINGDPNTLGSSILCFSKDYLKQFIENKNDNWFYECNGDFLKPPHERDRSMSSFIDYPYIKIFINEDGLNGFVPLIQIKKILESNHRIYYINPMLDSDGTQKNITHSVTWQNSYGPRSNRNYVSANHCQAGSSILIYTLKICKDPERCVRSLKNNIISGENLYNDSNSSSYVRPASTRAGTPLVYSSSTRPASTRPASTRATSSRAVSPRSAGSLRSALVIPASIGTETPIRVSSTRPVSTGSSTSSIPASPRSSTRSRSSSIIPVSIGAETPIRVTSSRPASTRAGAYSRPTSIGVETPIRVVPPRPSSTRAASPRASAPPRPGASTRADSPRAGIPPRPAPASKRAASPRAGIPPRPAPASKRTASPRAGAPTRARSPLFRTPLRSTASPPPTSSTRKSKKIKRSRRCKPCKKSCSRKKVCNPRTSRCVNKKGSIGKKLLSKKYLRSSKCKPCKKSCNKKKICNPRSARCVDRKGIIGKKLLRKKSK